MGEGVVVSRVKFDFTGARVLVTGGTSGIGHAIARAFADAGASVLVTGRRLLRGEYDVSDDLEVYGAFGARRGRYEFLRMAVAARDDPSGALGVSADPADRSSRAQARSTFSCATDPAGGTPWWWDSRDPSRTNGSGRRFRSPDRSTCHREAGCSADRRYTGRWSRRRLGRWGSPS